MDSGWVLAWKEFEKSALAKKCNDSQHDYTLFFMLSFFVFAFFDILRMFWLTLCVRSFHFRPEKLRIQKWYTIYKDHITLEDYEIHDGMSLEL